jgi:transcriptional regulator with XRE-family HTH domain/predicted Zn-ribbon and HTH transcriptional regulator
MNMTARAFVANERRQAREMKNLSRAKLADEIFVSESLIAAWERGRIVPGEQHHPRLREVLDLPDMITRVIGDLVTNEVSPEWFGKWPQIERQATSLWSFQPCLVPGLLQTSDYARAVLEAAHLDIDLEEALTTRLDRQQVLIKEDPPMFVALIAEAVLRHRVSNDKVMNDQLARLAEMAERENIVVQIVPANSKACAGFIGGFVIASFDGNEIGYVDNQLDGDTIESAAGAARLRRFFDVFRADALNQQESINLIQRVAEEWK